MGVAPLVLCGAATQVSGGTGQPHQWACSAKESVDGEIRAALHNIHLDASLDCLLSLSVSVPLLSLLFSSLLFSSRVCSLGVLQCWYYMFRLSSQDRKCVDGGRAVLDHKRKRTAFVKWRRATLAVSHCRTTAQRRCVVLWKKWLELRHEENDNETQVRCCASSHPPPTSPQAILLPSLSPSLPPSLLLVHPIWIRRFGLWAVFRIETILRTLCDVAPSLRVGCTCGVLSQLWIRVRRFALQRAVRRWIGFLVQKRNRCALMRRTE